MSMFPGANATVYRNEAGEPVGWDYPSDDSEPYTEWEEANDRDMPFKCRCGAEVWDDDIDQIVSHYEACDAPEWFAKRFPDELHDEADVHQWGPMEIAWMTGNPHRKCQVSGCSAISLDFGDE